VAEDTGQDLMEQWVNDCHSKYCESSRSQTYHNHRDGKEDPIATR
jgi:hypothetical protein